MMEKKFPAMNPKVESAAVSEGFSAEDCLGFDLHTFDIWFSLLHLLQIFPKALQSFCLSAELLLFPCLGPPQ